MSAWPIILHTTLLQPLNNDSSVPDCFCLVSADLHYLPRASLHQSVSFREPWWCMRLCDRTRWGHSSSPRRACHNQRFSIRGFPPGAFLAVPHNRECEDSVCNIIVSKLSRVNKISSIVKLWSTKTKQESSGPLYLFSLKVENSICGKISFMMVGGW